MIPLVMYHYYECTDGKIYRLEYFITEIDHQGRKTHTVACEQNLPTKTIYVNFPLDTFQKMVVKDLSLPEPPTLESDMWDFIRI